MIENEGLLIKELYEEKLMGRQCIINSYDRMKQIQKNIKENLWKKPEKLGFSLTLKDHTGVENTIQSQYPQYCVLPQNKHKPSFLETNKSYSAEKKFAKNIDIPEINWKTNEPFCKNKNFHQQQSTISNLGKKECAQITQRSTIKKYRQKYQKINIQPLTALKRPSTHVQNRPFYKNSNSAIHNSNEYQSQSKIQHENKYSKLSIQIQKYHEQMRGNRQIETKKIEEVPKIFRSYREDKKSQRNSFRIKDHILNKQQKKILVKLSNKHYGEKQLKLTAKEKEQIGQLMPWSVLIPEYQYY